MSRQNPRRRRSGSIRDAAPEPLGLDAAAPDATASGASDPGASDPKGIAGAVPGGAEPTQVLATPADGPIDGADTALDADAAAASAGSLALIDPHGDPGDVIRDVPEMSVEDVERRIGVRSRERRRRVARTVPATQRVAANRRIILWRDTATILIFVVVALLAARLLLPGATGSTGGSLGTDDLGSLVAIGSLPNGTGLGFSPAPTLGGIVDPSLGLGASPTPIPLITLGPLTPPSPPQNAVATRGNQAVQVDWGAPATDGNTRVLGYTVTSNPGGLTCVTGGALSCTVSGLKNGTAYTFTVTARNRIGTSAPSDPTLPVTPAAVPGKPTAVVATPGDGKATVTWAPPTSSGGSPIIDYTVTWGVAGQECTTPATTRLCPIPGLTNGKQYTIKVTARNSVGSGLPATAAVTPQAPATPPPSTPTAPPPTPTPTPPPTPPTASFTWNCDVGGGFVVDFDGTGSTAGSAGGPLTYAWSFGDTTATAMHTYPDATPVSVTLTVTDTGSGLQDTSPSQMVTPCA